MAVKILKKYIFIGLLFCFAINYLQAQQRFSQMYAYYEQQHYSELQVLVDKEKETAKNSFDVQFFKALFIRDGEEAAKVYEHLYKKASGKAAFYAAKKLMNYYYAKGYYIRASEYEKYLVEHPIIREELSPSAPNLDGGKYFIQVGAFSLPENAMQQVGFLAVQNIKSEVVQVSVKGKNLYCVWIPGRVNLDKTLELANQIKKKYALEYQIKKK